jgi:hypothetical protein
MGQGKEILSYIYKNILCFLTKKFRLIYTFFFSPNVFQFVLNSIFLYFWDC